MPGQGEGEDSVAWSDPRIYDLERTVERQQLENEELRAKLQELQENYTSLVTRSTATKSAHLTIINSLSAALGRARTEVQALKKELAEAG